MALSFPASPSVGQTSTQNGRQYVYVGNNAWELVASSSDSRWNLFLPPAPTGVAGLSGNAQSVVSWNAPSVLSQTPIQDYAIQYSSDSGSTWATFTRAASTATSATVTGLTNGTSYTFRVAAITGVGTGSYSTASGAVTPVTDSYFSSVSVLLHMNGSGTTFTDSSGSQKAITAYGNATQSTAQSKFGGASALFDGSGDYLSGTASDATRFSGDFTVEFWAFVLAHKSYNVWFDCRSSVSSANGFSFASNSSGQMALFTANGFAITSSSAFSASQWTHFALVRSGSTITLYQGGQSVGTTTNSTNFSDGALGVGISLPDLNHSVNGYIDELRITKIARYTGSTITVPTSEFPNA